MQDNAGRYITNLDTGIEMMPQDANAHRKRIVGSRDASLTRSSGFANSKKVPIDGWHPLSHHVFQAPFCMSRGFQLAAEDRSSSSSLHS